MTALFLVLLAIAWGVVFVPAVVRARQQAPASTAERFKRGMGVLATPPRRAGRWVITPGARDIARRKRTARKRQLFMALVGTAGATFVLALIRSSLWDLHLLVDSALISYVVLLVALKRQKQEAQQKVAYIEPAEDDRAFERQRAVGELEFEDPPGGLLEPYESLEPAHELEDFEFYEAVKAGGR